jgi:hypothetical protein
LRAGELVVTRPFVTLRVDPSVLVVAHASLEYGEAVVALYARRR